MGYSLCIVAIFGHFQNALVFRILAVFGAGFCIKPLYCVCRAFFCNIQNGLIFQISCFFLERFFAQNNYNVLVDSFLRRFWQLYFLTLSDGFEKAIAFEWRPFLPIFKMVSFLEYQMFFRAVFAQNNYKFLVDGFLICFWQFNILTQNDFTKAIAFAWRLFWPIFKLVLFFEYQLFLEPFFAQNNFNVFVDMFLAWLWPCQTLCRGRLEKPPNPAILRKK